MRKVLTDEQAHAIALHCIGLSGAYDFTASEVLRVAQGEELADDWKQGVIENALKNPVPRKVTI